MLIFINTVKKQDIFTLYFKNQKSCAICTALFLCLYLWSQDMQQILNALLYLSADDTFQRTGVTVPIEGVKGIIISPAVRVFDIDGGISCLHQHQVEYQPACPSVSIYEWMYSLESQMEKRCLLNDMSLHPLMVMKELLHLRLYHIGLNGSVSGTQYGYRHTSPDTPVFRPIRKHERMNALDHVFRESGPVLD